MRRLTLTEGHPPRAVDLSDSQAAVLDGAELAVVSRVPGQPTWLVAAGSKVGVLRIDDLQVTVQPKISIDRLVFLMGYAREPTFWRDRSVRLASDADLVESLEASFTRLAGRALDQGVLHGYLSRDDTLPVLRGRLRVGDQIRHQHGRGIPLEISYDDFTVDVAENQLLLGALLRLLRTPTINRTSRQALQRLRLQLVDVTPPAPGLPLPTWQPSRLNTRYQPALRLAELILSGQSFEQRHGDVEVSGFVFDMWRIYEDFVCVALREALRPAGGTASLQHRGYLDEALTVDIRPDLVWTSAGVTRLVVDAKYKVEKPAGFPQADLYQLLAYCTVLGLGDGHLVYAAGEGTERVHHIVGAAVRIHCHTLDLGLAPNDLLNRIQALAGLMAGPDQASLVHTDSNSPTCGRQSRLSVPSVGSQDS